MSEMTLVGSDYATLAKAMGMEVQKKEKSSNLARLKLSADGLVVGDRIVKKGGIFELELANGSKLYQTDPTIRIFLQRYMYKRYKPEAKNYVKSVMSLSLKDDLIDMDGTHNCGRPSGFIEDFDSLPEQQKALIKAVRRTRVLFGTIKFTDAVDEKGGELDCSKAEDIPFIYEVDSKEGYKVLGDVVDDMINKEKLLPEFLVQLEPQSRQLNNGKSYYIPSFSVVEEGLDPAEEVLNTCQNFIAWVDSYNAFVLKKSGASESVDSPPLVQDVEVQVVEPAVKEPIKKISKAKKTSAKEKKDLGDVLNNWAED